MVKDSAIDSDSASDDEDRKSANTYDATAEDQLSFQSDINLILRLLSLTCALKQRRLLFSTLC